MKRSQNFNQEASLTPKQINRNVAIHEAGHAAAIYFGNSLKELPPVHFQIFITPLGNDVQSSQYLIKPDSQFIARIDGGRLIHTLPSSIEEATADFSSAQAMEYKQAFKADMMNLLVGPLAEANAIAVQDGELFNPGLVNVNELHFYGGCYDVDNFYAYLECFTDHASIREQKTAELFLEAFNFVNDRAYWRSIMALADYIVEGNQSLIEYDEIVTVLKTANSAPAFNMFAGYTQVEK